MLSEVETRVAAVGHALASKNASVAQKLPWVSRLLVTGCGSRSCPHCSEDVCLHCGWNINTVPLGWASSPLGGFFFGGTPGKARLLHFGSSERVPVGRLRPELLGLWSSR